MPSERRRLSRSLLVRTSDELATRVDMAAKARGVSSAAWLRELAADALNGSEPSDRQRSPVRVRRPIVLPAELELRAMVRDLGRLTGAIIQLAKALREAQRPERLSAEQLLSEVRATTAKAAILVERLR